jgi:hypothetical protein
MLGAGPLKTSPRNNITQLPESHRRFRRGWPLNFSFELGLPRPIEKYSRFAMQNLPRIEMPGKPFLKK